MIRTNKGQRAGVITSHNTGRNTGLGPVYTERQCQCSVNAPMILVILLRLKTMQ